MAFELSEIIVNEIKKLNKEKCIVAIDGRCASGKTTLAQQLHNYFHCSVIHMDDFFLQPCQRTESRLSQAGGNIDYERFVEEIVQPLKSNDDFSYRVFDCKKLVFGEEVHIHQADVIIIEGSYSCHPKFRNIYDLTVFLDVDRDKQLSRIEKRNGIEQLKIFKIKWIPMEEKYFKAFDIQGNSDIILKS